jgi:hypothetical protein
MDLKQLTQNANRYGVSTTDRKHWVISAGKDIQPITLVAGKDIELIPLLEVEGIVVKILDVYLISPVTLKKIIDYDNPHYSVVQNGEVRGVPMGKTIPIIELNTTGLIEIGDGRDTSNLFAAVKSVDYGYETKTIEGIPIGLLQQINYTLKDKGSRPADTFSIWDLGLTGNYSIEALKIQTAQDDGSLDQNKLDGFVKGVGDRLKVLREDFNSIKEIFYNGSIPLKATNSYSFTKVANVEDMDDEKKRGERGVVKKTIDVVGVTPTPSQLAATTAKNLMNQTAEIKVQQTQQMDTTAKEQVGLKQGLAALLERLKTAGIK